MQRCLAIYVSGIPPEPQHVLHNIIIGVRSSFAQSEFDFGNQLRAIHCQVQRKRADQ